MDDIKRSIIKQYDEPYPREYDAETFLKMKDDYGEYIFPWERIKYNAEYKSKMFVLEHLTHLPEKWYTSNDDLPEELHYKCPICGEGAALAAFTKTKLNNLFYRHKCTGCGFKVNTMYACDNEGYVKSMKDSSFKWLVEKLFFELESMEFKKIYNDDLLSPKRKAELVKERTEYWTKRKNALL